MAETLVENQTCRHCGADVRTGALFCYNCGSAVAPEDNSADEEETILKPKFSETISRENGSENSQREIKTKLKDKEISPNPLVENSQKPDSLENSKLKTAAELRDKPKQIQPKKIEIIWEKSETAPNIWFILTAIFLTIFAVVILILAIRMK